MVHENQAARLFRNDETTFAEAGAAAGVNDSQTNKGELKGDFDDDGDLDLYLATSNNRLLQNTGGTYSNVAAAAGVASGNMTVGPAWGD